MNVLRNQTASCRNEPSIFIFLFAEHRMLDVKAHRSCKDRASAWSTAVRR